MVGGRAVMVFVELAEKPHLRAEDAVATIVAHGEEGKTTAPPGMRRGRGN